MLSLTYGLGLATPKMRWVFVSFSVKSSGTAPSQDEIALSQFGIDGLDDSV